MVTETDQMLKSPRRWAHLAVGSGVLTVASWIFGYEDNYGWLSKVLPVPRYVELSDTGWVALGLALVALALAVWALRSTDRPMMRIVAAALILVALAMAVTGILWTLIRANY